MCPPGVLNKLAFNPKCMRLNHIPQSTILASSCTSSFQARAVVMSTKVSQIIPVMSILTFCSLSSTVVNNGWVDNCHEQIPLCGWEGVKYNPLHRCGQLLENRSCLLRVQPVVWRGVGFSWEKKHSAIVIFNMPTNHGYQTLLTWEVISSSEGLPVTWKPLIQWLLHWYPPELSVLYRPADRPSFCSWLIFYNLLF